MGCPAQVILGNSLVFSISTHDPDTSVKTDCDSLPTYRIYEDSDSVPILTGTMDRLNDAVDANNVGNYRKSIACTTANGFESGKTYTIYITATVDSDTGGISFSFNIFDRAAGAGAITFTYTLTSTVDSTPVADANIWVTTDLAGNNIIASGVTNAAGQVTLYLELATGTTVYVWRSKTGWTLTNPDTEVL